ncbi:MAG: histidine phosphatase family protein [Patescibacteria group bacterium]
MKELDFDCTFYFVRHVRSAANDEPEIIGGINAFTPATKLGMLQGQAIGRRLFELSVNFDAIYSSRTRRTKTTAGLICRETELDPKKIRISKELVERDQGDWVGRVRSETYTPEVLAQMNMNVLDLAPPNGESLRQKGRSMMTWVEKEVLHNPEFIGLSKMHPLHIIVVTHGLALQCLLREILGFDAQFTWRWAMENASLTIMRYTKNGWYPVCINDTGHLVGI